MTGADDLRPVEAIDADVRQLSHDFNNLIGIIINYAAFVADALEPGSPARQDLQEIQHAAERATELSRQLRCVCEPNSGNG